MKIYTIVGGVNGTGKSSLTGVLKARQTDLGMIIDVDKLSIEQGGAIAGGKEALSRISECLHRGISFTQETTLSGGRTEQTAKKAKEKGYYVRLFYIGLSSATESKKRIRNRVEKGGHDIPSQDVERRFAHRWQALTQVLPYCDEATFFDNENGFVEVAEYRNGELVVGKADQPSWVYEMEDYLRTHLWENILGKEHRELQR